jgi:V/A-type H+-transporting ATPase subunit A
MIEEDIIGKIDGVSGPIVFSEIAEKAKDLMMNEIIYVGEQQLIGEVTSIRGTSATIQVYEETLGLQKNEPIFRTRQLLSVNLGPGLIGSLYDGLQRPLERIMDETGPFIMPGSKSARLQNKEWLFKPKAQVNIEVKPGDIIGFVSENDLIEHKIMVPPGVRGKLISLEEKGNYTISDKIGEVIGKSGMIPLKMAHSWPVKQCRPYTRKTVPSEPLLTGQRVLDTLLPICKGGTATIGGGFGTGKTVLQNQFLKFLNVDIIVYIGCGERGNEIADLLQTIPNLKDIKTGLPIDKRTVTIANTSNMPVAARESSIYAGATIGEYYRDMGYDVALLVDSTTRWAEALREISSRQGEMPGEEGYPPYLTSRLAEFYGRAGKVTCLGKDNRIGSLSIIASVSPSGGDFSEPVTQKTTQVVRSFWALDPELAYRRYYPAVNISQSFSYYHEIVEPFWREMIGTDWITIRENALKLYNEKIELEKIVNLVGKGAFSEEEKITFMNAELLEDVFLKQDSLHPIDMYTSPMKQFQLLSSMLAYHENCMEAIKKGVPIKSIIQSPLREELRKLRFEPEKDMDESYRNIRARIREYFNRLYRTFL